MLAIERSSAAVEKMASKGGASSGGRVVAFLALAGLPLAAALREPRLPVAVALSLAALAAFVRTVFRLPTFPIPAAGTRIFAAFDFAGFAESANVPSFTHSPNLPFTMPVQASKARLAAPLQHL